MNQQDVAGSNQATAQQRAVKAKKGTRSLMSTTSAFGRNIGDFVAAVRGLGVEDVLVAAGLAKKPTVAARAGTLGAGVTVGMGIGIGIGILFAPRAGMETRAILRLAARSLLGRVDKHEEIQDRRPAPANKLDPKLAVEPFSAVPAPDAASMYSGQAELSSHSSPRTQK